VNGVQSEPFSGEFPANREYYRENPRSFAGIDGWRLLYRFQFTQVLRMKIQVGRPLGTGNLGPVSGNNGSLIDAATEFGQASQIAAHPEPTLSDQTARAAHSARRDCPCQGPGSRRSSPTGASTRRGFPQVNLSALS
jgi:hypothetical protein